MDQRAAAHVHYTLLIACVLVAFFLGAILSGFMMSCYCGRSAAHRARRLGKDSEMSLPHALSLRSLAKLNGLLERAPKEDKLDVSTPKMDSCFIPSGAGGLSLGDPELHVSQVTTSLRSLSETDGELSGLPTPGSSPQLPIKSMKALHQHQHEKNQYLNNTMAKNLQTGSSPGFTAVVGNSIAPYSHHHGNSLSNGAAHGTSSTSLHLPEEREILNEGRVVTARGGGGEGGSGGGVYHHHHSQLSLAQAAANVSALDELLKQIHEVSASGTGGIKVLTSISSSSGGQHHPVDQGHLTHHSHHHSNQHSINSSRGGCRHHQQKIPEPECAGYSSTTLPRDAPSSSSSSSSSSNNPPSSKSIPSASSFATSSSSSSTPLQPKGIPERLGVSSVSVARHHSQRHSLIKMGSGGVAVPRHHSFNQGGVQHAHFLARMNTNSSSNGPPDRIHCESQRPLVASSCLTRQHSYTDGPHVQRAAIVRRTASLKPQVPPKPSFLPNTAASATEEGKYNY